MPLKNTSGRVVDQSGLELHVYGVAFDTGTNKSKGTFVANGTSAVTVANTTVAITDNITISLNTVGGTVGAVPHVSTITAGTGFTVVGTASDTSTYNYTILR